MMMFNDMVTPMRKKWWWWGSIVRDSQGGDHGVAVAAALARYTNTAHNWILILNVASGDHDDDDDDDDDDDEDEYDHDEVTQTVDIIESSYLMPVEIMMKQMYILSY